MVALHARVLSTRVRNRRNDPIRGIPRLPLSDRRHEDGGVPLERDEPGVMGVHRPIRMLRVIPRYAPAWRYGGSVRFSYDLDVALLDRGFAITVYTSDQIDERHRSPSGHERLNGIDVHRFPNPSNYLASQAAWLGLYPIGLRQALFDTVGR